MDLIEFLQVLQRTLGDGESLQWHVTRQGESLSVTFIPKLTTDSEVPDEAKPVRAALAMPLVFRDMSLSEIAESLGERLSGYGQARKRAQSAYDELMAALNDASANAKNATAQTKAQKTSKPEATTSTSQPKDPQKDEKSSEAKSGSGVLDF